MSLVDYSSSEDEAEAMELAPSQSATASLVLPDAEHELRSLDNSRSKALNVENKQNTRKRILENGSSSGPQQKVAHGKLAATRYSPDTAGGQLIPPQLRQGRKNIVTEDLDKLFVAKQKAKVAEQKR